MALGKKLTDNVMEYGVLAMVIVIISIILIKFSENSSVACEHGYIYNGTLDLCHTSGNVSLNSSVTSLPGTIDTFISAFSEPQNWIVIIIIAIIGFALLKLFQMKNK